MAPAHARIENASGGAWSGHGTLLVNATDLGRINWDAHFWPLLTGHLEAGLHLRGTDIKAHAELNASRSALQVNGLKGQADLALLARLAGMPNTAQGTLQADLKKVSLSMQGLVQNAQGEIDIHNVRLPALDVSLGTLFLRLNGNADGNTVHAVINNSGGDLDISGQIMLSGGNRYTLIAYLKPHSGKKNDPMRDALSAMIGSPDSQGRYRYVTSGRLND